MKSEAGRTLRTGGRAPTCGQVDDVDEGILGLHDIHGHVGEAAAVLHEGGHGAHRLHHFVHQDELLRVLQVPLREGTRLSDYATTTWDCLEIRSGHSWAWGGKPNRQAPGELAGPPPSLWSHHRMPG